MYAPCYADIITTFDTAEYSLVTRIAFVIPTLLTGACSIGFLAAFCIERRAFRNTVIFLIISLGILHLFGSILEVTNLLKTLAVPSFLLYLYIPISSLSVCSNVLLLLYTYTQSRPLIGRGHWTNGTLITLSLAILMLQTYFRCFAVLSPSETDQQAWLRTYQQIYLYCFIIIDSIYCAAFANGIRHSLYIDSAVGPASKYVDRQAYLVYKSSSVRFLFATTLGIAQHALLASSAHSSLALLYISVALGQLRIMVYMMDSCIVELVHPGKSHVLDLWRRRSSNNIDQRRPKLKGNVFNAANSSQEQSFSSLEFSFEERDIEIDQMSLQLLNTLTPPPRWPSNAALRKYSSISKGYTRPPPICSPESLLLRRDTPTLSTYDTFGRSRRSPEIMPSI